MYRSIDDFLNDWRNESEATLKIFTSITDQVSKETLHEDVRSLGRLAWHLTQTITEMGCKAGLFQSDELEHQDIPLSIAELVASYQNYCTLMGRTVQLKWTDSSLSEKLPMYGEPWEKGKILRVMIAHQSHHRGQMTVIMRLLGLPVIGVYGPSKQEWTEMGLPPME